MFCGLSGEVLIHINQLLMMPTGVSMGTYGKLTVSAVEAFQEKNSIAHKGDAGYGKTGPKTRAAIAGM